MNKYFLAALLTLAFGCAATAQQATSTPTANTKTANREASDKAKMDANKSIAPKKRTENKEPKRVTMTKPGPQTPADKKAGTGSGGLNTAPAK